MGDSQDSNIRQLLGIGNTKMSKMNKKAHSGEVA